MKLRERKRMGFVMRQIYHLFEPQLSTESPHLFKRRKVLAADALKVVSGSHVTIMRAREYLGVEARVIAGRHCWLPPRVNLQDALDKAKHGSKSNLYQVRIDRHSRDEMQALDIVPVLKQILKTHGHDIEPREAKDEVKNLVGRTYPGRVLNLARIGAGIISRKLSDGWHWLLPPDGIQEWLEERLADGPIAYPILLTLMEKAGWNDNILNLFRTGYGFAQFKKDRLWFWYDINTWSPEK